MGLSLRKIYRRLAAVIGVIAFAGPATASDRVIVYPLQNPISTQQSLVQRYPRVAIGNLARDMFGPNNTGGTYTNMTINPVTGLYVNVAPTTANNDGTLYQLGENDANPIPVNITPQLAADPTVIMLQGLLSAASSSIGPIAVPGSSGQRQYTLIEAQIQSQDTAPQQELFVNVAGGKYYQTVNTDRTDAIVFQAKAGTAGSSPSVPSTDTGWVSIGTILVPYAATQINPGGTSTATGSTSLTDSTQSWGVNAYTGDTVISGSSVGTITSNTSTVLTVSSWTGGTPSSSLPYTINMIAMTSPFPGFTTASGTITSVTASAPLASSGGTTPNLTLSTPITVAYGGSGAASFTANNVLLGNGTSAFQVVAPGTTGNVLTSNGSTWQSSAPTAAGVNTFSAGTTGFTPSTASTGTVTLAGTLATTNGGTGLTSFTSGKAVYATSTSALTTGTLPTTAGGTGLAAFTSGGAVYATSTSALTTGTLPVTAGGSGAATLTGYLSGNGTSAFTASTTIPTSALTGTVATANGGTNLSSFTSGGAVYATSGSVLTTGTLPVASGGTGVTASTGATSVMLRDSNGNTAINNIAIGLTSTASAGGTTNLTAASTAEQLLTGSSAQTYTLPNATTLANGNFYAFSNTSTGSLTINNNGGTGLYTVPAGADEVAILTGNGTANGTWDIHGFAPSGATWGTGSLNLGSSSTLTATNATLSGTLTPGYNGTAGTAAIYSGTGTPAFSAPAGSLFLSYSGTGGALAYYNSSTAGTSGTTWTSIGTGGGGGAGGAVYPAPTSPPFPAGCAYNSTLPTLTTGTTGEVQCDIHGNLILNVVLSAPSPLPVQAAAIARTYEGGTVATGGTAQTLFAAAAITHGCDVQNTSTAAEYIRADGSAASATSLYLAPNGGYYECPLSGLPTSSVSIYGPTTGQTFYAEEW